MRLRVLSDCCEGECRGRGVAGCKRARSNATVLVRSRLCRMAGTCECGAVLFSVLRIGEGVVMLSVLLRVVLLRCFSHLYFFRTDVVGSELWLGARIYGALVAPSRWGFLAPSVAAARLEVTLFPPGALRHRWEVGGGAPYGAVGCASSAHPKKVPKLFLNCFASPLRGPAKPPRRTSQFGPPFSAHGHPSELALSLQFIWASLPSRGASTTGLLFRSAFVAGNGLRNAQPQRFGFSKRSSAAFLP